MSNTVLTDLLRPSQTFPRDPYDPIFTYLHTILESLCRICTCRYIESGFLFLESHLCAYSMESFFEIILLNLDSLSNFLAHLFVLPNYPSASHIFRTKLLLLSFLHVLSAFLCTILSPPPVLRLAADVLRNTPHLFPCFPSLCLPVLHDGKRIIIQHLSIAAHNFKLSFYTNTNTCKSYLFTFPPFHPIQLLHSIRVHL